MINDNELLEDNSYIIDDSIPDRNIILGDDGRIAINDTMSDELKEKIAQYNAELDGDNSSDEDEEENDLADSFESDNSYISNDESKETVKEEVSQSELNSLNDLFL